MGRRAGFFSLVRSRRRNHRLSVRTGPNGADAVLSTGDGGERAIPSRRTAQSVASIVLFPHPRALLPGRPALLSLGRCCASVDAGAFVDARVGGGMLRCSLELLIAAALRWSSSRALFAWWAPKSSLRVSPLSKTSYCPWTLNHWTKRPGRWIRDRCSVVKLNRANNDNNGDLRYKFWLFGSSRGKGLGFKHFFSRAG